MVCHIMLDARLGQHNDNLRDRSNDSPARLGEGATHEE